MIEKRNKKPSVPPELRREWLRRYTEYGDSYRKIAREYDYDQRTVKSHIEKALHETAQNQARILFVKENLEKHHQDLCRRVDELLDDVTAEKPITFDNPEDLYLNGLRQHLHRSVVWNKISTWTEMLEKLEQQYALLKTTLEKAVKKTQLDTIQSDPMQGVPEAAIAVLNHQIQQWSRGSFGLDINNDWHTEERKAGKVVVRYGFSHFGWIREQDIKLLKAQIASLEENIKGWPEYIELENIMGNVMKLKQDLRIELKGILIRRVIPGTCIFCPI